MRAFFQIAMSSMLHSSIFADLNPRADNRNTRTAEGSVKTTREGSQAGASEEQAGDCDSALSDGHGFAS